jgi:non-specific serine/threonine protein kinase
MAEHACRFGAFELQLDERRLLKDGEVVALRPRAFDLLAALVGRAEHLVTKDELLERVWPKMVVEEAALHVQVSALRKVLGADAIATVSGKGYRFSLPVVRGEESSPSRKHNLPSQLTSFIGREQEIAELKESLATSRLVTLTGAGGAGKTRLAIEVAGAVIDGHPDGVWLVELGSLAEPTLVPQAVASVLAIKDQPGRPLLDTIAESLASKRLLLIVDNAEHLLEACARFVDAILRRCTQVAILVTSRERLGIAGELTYRVPSLSVPAANESATPQSLPAYEGVRLFLDRARLLRPHFNVTLDNAAAVASICSRLDGIPLAIELAAPRLRSMSVEELSQRLDQRFALLTDGSRAALPRHRTLRSMIDWSYDLLTDPEQSMLRRASVFAGGWTLASAEEVCAGDGIDRSAVIDLLASLVDKSLIVADERDGATRYRMLETVRQYAGDRLRERGEEAPLRAAHLSHFTDLAEQAHTTLYGPGRRSSLARLAIEHDNFRGALAWSAASGAAGGLMLLPSLYALWQAHGRLEEGCTWCTRVLDSVASERPTLAHVRASHAAAVLATMHGDRAAANALYQKNLVMARELDHPKAIAHALTGLAHVACVSDDPTAEARCRDALSYARTTEERYLIAVNAGNLGILVQSRGDWAAARPLYDEAEKIAREIGDPALLGQGLANRGYAECAAGCHEAARAQFTESITALQEIGDQTFILEAVEGFATLALATGSLVRAVRLLAAGEGLRRSAGAARTFLYQRRHLRESSATRARLGDDAFERAWAVGGAMTLDEAVRYALADDE